MKAGEALVTLRVNISVSVNGTFDIFNATSEQKHATALNSFLNVKLCSQGTSAFPFASNNKNGKK